MISILGVYVDDFFPRFNTNTNRVDEGLLREVRLAITQIESGDVANALILLNRIFREVRGGDIRRER